MKSPGIFEVLLALVLVVISIVVARWWRIPVAKDMALGSVRTFIQLIADDRVYCKILKPGEKPEATFQIDAKKVTARAYCNLHGLWKSK